MMWACGVERAAGKCARRAPRANHDDRPTPESARRNARPTTKPHRRDRSADDAENCDARTHRENNSLVTDRRLGAPLDAESRAHRPGAFLTHHPRPSEARRAHGGMARRLQGRKVRRDPSRSRTPTAHFFPSDEAS